MLASLGFPPIDHQVTYLGIGARQHGLAQVLGHAGGPLITAFRTKPASPTAPTHLVPVAYPSDPIPTQGRHLLKQGVRKPASVTMMGRQPTGNNACNCRRNARCVRRFSFVFNVCTSSYTVRATVHRQRRPQQKMAFAIQVRPINQQHRAGAHPNEQPTQVLIVLHPLGVKSHVSDSSCRAPRPMAVTVRRRPRSAPSTLAASDARRTQCMPGQTTSSNCCTIDGACLTRNPGSLIFGVRVKMLSYKPVPPANLNAFLL